MTNISRNPDEKSIPSWTKKNQRLFISNSVETEKLRCDAGTLTGLHMDVAASEGSVLVLSHATVRRRVHFWSEVLRIEWAENKRPVASDVPEPIRRFGNDLADRFLPNYDRRR